MPDLKRNQFLQQSRISRREMALAGRREWLGSKQDKETAFQSDFADWLKWITRFDEIATRLLYKKDGFELIDLRYHRSALAELISNGEALAIEVYELAAEGTVDDVYADRHVTLIDQHLDEMTERLHEWHGKLDHQADVPQSFKDGIREISEGKVVEMEKALNEEPQ